MTLENKTQHCLFCQKHFRSEQLFSNQYFFAVADGSPVNPGHLLIIPYRHVEDYFSLNREEAASLYDMLNQGKTHCRDEQIRQGYLRTLANQQGRGKSKQFASLAIENWDKKITGYNIGINNGLSAGQTIFHLHIHLIPRFNGDVADPTGGVRFVIPQRANYR